MPPVLRGNANMQQSARCTIYTVYSVSSDEVVPLYFKFKMMIVLTDLT